MKNREINNDWDLIIAGGGVTGAGILREAVRMNLRVLLLEQNDFAWGTSSRSSKLVHGGLRYLKQGRLLLTRDSVKERERLLREAPGLVDPLEFLIPIYQDHGPGKWLIRAGLSLYDVLAMNWRHQFYDPHRFTSLEPHLRSEKLVGGFSFLDAQVDDARLVLRLVREAKAAGGCAENYTSVTEILRDIRGNVVGVRAEDTETREEKIFSARAVINATGVWAETLHPSPRPNLHIRPLRGSHLVFPAHVLPVSHAVSFSHPADQRQIFVIPWEGAVMFGTTDLDHEASLAAEPAITEAEITYLMDALELYFPCLDISEKDCLSAFAGVRPVLSKGGRDPSAESREHVIWKDKGLVTITGGKLTTFRKLAWDALDAAIPFLPPVQKTGQGNPVFSSPSDTAEKNDDLSPEALQRLYGRYGKAANEILEAAAPEDLEPIPHTHTLWAELPFVAKHEQVRHLSDLMLRRVRIGLLTADGGEEHLPRIRNLCQSALAWDQDRWKTETDAYQRLWKQAYSVR